MINFTEKKSVSKQLETTKDAVTVLNKQLVETFIVNKTYHTLTDSEGEIRYTNIKQATTDDATYHALKLTVATNQNATVSGLTNEAESAQICECNNQITKLFMLNPSVPILKISSNKDVLDNKDIITFAFNENVTDFTIDDISVANCTIDANSFTGSGKNYTVTVTPTLGGHNNAAVYVAIGSFLDSNANKNTKEYKNETSIANLGEILDIKNNDINIENFDVSHAIDAHSAFKYQRHFNQDIGNWETGAIMNMSYMFKNAIAFNQELNWNTASVVDMSFMFNDAVRFNKNIGNWDTGAVKNMNSMFENAIVFNQKLNWNTASVVDMSYMFCKAVSFNQDISDWKTDAVTNMKFMFYEAAVFNQELNWKTASVTNMDSVFYRATAFNQELNWNTASVTNMNSMFRDTKLFNGNIDDWDTSKVISMNFMFSDARSFDGNIGSWNTAKVKGMAYMFSGATHFNQYIGNWDTSRVSNMIDMFTDATLFNKDISNWNTAKVLSMESMFLGAAFDQDIGNWDISSLLYAETMFTDINNYSSMSLDNMDSTLRGWAKFDPSEGETSIYGNVRWGIANYTDATAREYLIDRYDWTIDGGIFDNSNTIKGSNSTDVLFVTDEKNTLHGLGGNDTLVGKVSDDILVGGAGDDHLTGGEGNDIFDYGFKNAGNDTIIDFSINQDKINLADLLMGYTSDYALASMNILKSSVVSEFVSANGDDNTIISIDYDGVGTNTDIVTITLKGVSYNDNILVDLITSGNLVLE